MWVIIPLAEKAIETGCRQLIEALTNAVRAEVKERFEHMTHLKRHAEEGVDAAREYVAMLAASIHKALSGDENPAARGRSSRPLIRVMIKGNNGRPREVARCFYRLGVYNGKIGDYGDFCVPVAQNSLY
jgi:hypothetical protein